MKTGILGSRAEKLAAKFLKKSGGLFIEANYRCKVGEIDLIYQFGEYLVFVEVRYRKSQDYGGALESVDINKQRKLRRAAEHYLAQHRLFDQAARFDIVCLTGLLTSPSIQWIKNAF